MNYIIAHDTCPIRPEHIKADRHFWNAFGEHETETSARWLVLYCQERKRGWKPFERADLEAFVARKLEIPPRHFHFNSLVETDRLGQNRGPVMIGWNMVILSIEFVTRCYCSNPAV